MATRKCAAVVVGAGPAGVAVMGNLLERQLGAITWIDPSFEAGRVHSKYREVPRCVPDPSQVNISRKILTRYLQQHQGFIIPSIRKSHTTFPESDR